MSLNIARFIEANRLFPIEYYGIEGRTIAVRLANKSSWKIKLAEFRQLDRLRWAHDRSELP